MQLLPAFCMHAYLLLVAQHVHQQAAADITVICTGALQCHQLLAPVILHPPYY
jgi:hypothetical protein